MEKAFPEIVDVKFTANDGVPSRSYREDGTVKWKVVMRNFYPDLKER